ncbi:G5 and 3D domain-containing protein [Alkalicoccus halolimnae]|uniref:G5 domain-containing protein n=1 Tax=Alkalicoccus halolimnae TaxID=1667239 RepID=A0A5C7FC49_9BACI|nr:G5 and 3D domain-containing protein [Alkalicoccus halolimnae]TXF82140.1 DUF348 domain-containing protein [Alkalicoccus halolimnae]
MPFKIHSFFRKSSAKPVRPLFAAFAVLCLLGAVTVYDVTKAQVTVYANGEDMTYKTHAETVGEVLEENEIELDDHDRVQPPKAEEVSEETDIRIIRVEKETDIVEETIDYNTVQENDETLPAGEKEVQQTGAEGSVEKHYEVTMENGEEISRRLVKKEVVAESEEKIISVGTKEQQEEAAGPWQTFTATAYTASCSGCSGVTRTGVDLKADPDARVIAVDPDVIPLGSRVEVKGHGEFLAADTGGAITGNKIDIFMSGKADAREFGRRNVQVRVLD